MVQGLDIPAAWQRVEWERLEGVIMVVGAVDTGKSTLVRYLWSRLATRGPLAVVDADIGQAVLGPPTTQTLRMATPDRPDEFPPRGRGARWFVGAISPRGHMLPTVTGVFRLVTRARRWGARAVLVDTTGMVHPQVGGVALKWAKFDLVQPDVVIALQRDRELEPLIGPWRQSQRFRLIELPVSPGVRVRSREERIAWRQYRFRLYFSRAEEVMVPLERVAVLGSQELVPGRLVGFLDRGGFLLALGIVRGREGNALRVLTPLRDVAKADAMRVGSLVLDGQMRDRRPVGRRQRRLGPRQPGRAEGEDASLPGDGLGGDPSRV